MNITTNEDWQDTSDYKFAFATTNDPRVLAVIETDEDASISQSLDGDAINPVYLIDYVGHYRASHLAGYSGDSEMAQRIVDARGKFREVAGYRYDGLSYAMLSKSHEILERWARVFHETVFEIFDNGGDTYLVMSSPTFRAHVDNESTFFLDMERMGVESIASEVRKVLAGEVYGIGYATLEGRVLESDEKINLDDWDVDMQCWGYIGEEYAKESAAKFEAGDPALPEMLEV